MQHDGLYWRYPYFLVGLRFVSDCRRERRKVPYKYHSVVALLRYFYSTVLAHISPSHTSDFPSHFYLGPVNSLYPQ